MGKDDENSDAVGGRLHPLVRLLGDSYPPPFGLRVTSGNLFVAVDGDGDPMMWADQPEPIEAAVLALNASYPENERPRGCDCGGLGWHWTPLGGKRYGHRCFQCFPAGEPNADGEATPPITPTHP